MLKKPACAAQLSEAISVSKKPATSPSPRQSLEYLTPLECCARCGGNLHCPGNQGVATASLYGSETVTTVYSKRKECSWRKCRRVFRPNFVWEHGEKINTLTYNQMCSMGVYFVNDAEAYTMEYLHLTYLRLARGKMAVGQEVAVRVIYHEDEEGMEAHSRRMRDNLLHALEGWALARRSPDEVVKYNVNHPASFVGASRRNLLFPPAISVDSLSFDGHFGIQRVYEKDVDSAREVQRRGRPRKPKFYGDTERTATCKDKARVRRVAPDRTCGWQFVTPSKVALLIHHFFALLAVLEREVVFCCKPPAVWRL